MGPYLLPPRGARSRPSHHTPATFDSDTQVEQGGSALILALAPQRRPFGRTVPATAPFEGRPSRLRDWKEDLKKGDVKKKNLGTNPGITKKIYKRNPRFHHIGSGMTFEHGKV